MDSTRLRGRDGELSALLDWLSGVQAGRGAVAAVVGPAGIGKTRLLSEVGEAAADRGCVVVSARPDRLGGVAPLAVLLEAFRSSSPPIITSEDLAGLAGLADQRFWLLDRLRATLEKRASRRPVLVIVDDLHWADSATLWAIGALATQLSSVPVGWLVARRPVPAGEELDALWGKLRVIEPLVVDLGPLPTLAVDAIAADLSGGAPDAELLALVRRAGGNPFLVVEAVRAAAAAGERDTRRTAIGHRRRLPADFVLNARSRFSGLSPSARRMLEVGAVFGGRFSLVDVGVLLGESVTALMPALRELVQAGVLAEEPDAGRVAFAHDLLWQAVYDDIPTAALRALHRDAARALIAAGAEPLEVAGHLLEGAVPGDAEAVDLLLHAARDAASRAPEIAADLYTRVLDLSTDPGPARDRALAEAVPVLAQAGRLDEMRQLAEHALDAGVDPDNAATVHYSLSVGEALRARFGQALSETRRGLARPALSAGSRAQLTAVGALYLAITGRIDAAIAQARTGTSLAEEAGRGVAAATSLSAEAIAHRMAGRFVVARDLAEESARRVEVETPVELPSAVLVLPRQWCVWMLTGLNRFTEAEAASLRSRRQMETLGTGTFLHTWHVRRASLRLAAARLDDAAAEAESAVAVAEELGSGSLLSTALALLAEIAVTRGDLQLARQYLSQSPPRGDGVYELEFDFARGLVAEALGDPVQALRDMAPVWAAFPHHFGILALTPPAAPHLVRIALRAGDRQRAAQAADAAARLADLNPEVATITGAAAHAAGLLAEDADMLRHAVDLYHGSPCPLPRALACEDAGAALAAAGRRTPAIESLDEALALLATADATGDANRVRRKLRTLGVRRRHAATKPRPTTGWTALSDPEIRVAHLVAAGLTNRAIAERLYLSRHTVDSHLRHIFAKLSINTRVDLTRITLDQTGAKEQATDTGSAG